MRITLSVFGDLTKYRLSMAVVFSSIAGYFLCRNTVTFHLLFLATGVFLLSSGSACLNQYTEIISDSMMERTRNRPIPAEKISKKTALLIAITLLICGSAFLYINGTFPLFLGLLTVALYNIVYTALKKKTILSIIPGAVVGALPPMIGYSSAGGTLFHLDIFAYSGFMFLWQIPHFWLILIKYGQEYKLAGFTTVSKYLTENQIRYLVFFWVLFSSIYLFLFFFIVVPYNIGILITLFSLNISFILLFYRLLFVKKQSQEIKGAFILINSFGLLIMFIIITISLLKFF